MRRLDSRHQAGLVPIRPSDLDAFAAARPDLVLWLEDTHGRGVQREALLALLGALIALVSLFVFSSGGLLVCVYLLIALLADGAVAVVVLKRHRRSDRPFVSPAHALAFAGLLRTAFRIDTEQGRFGRAPPSVLPGAERLRLPELLRSRPSPWLWKLISGTTMVLAYGGCAILFWVAVGWPMLSAAQTLFTPMHWLGLAAMSLLSVGQAYSAIRLNRDPARHWRFNWFVDGQMRIGDFWYWKHDRKVVAVVAFVLSFLLFMVFAGTTNGGGIIDGAAIAAEFDRRVVALVGIVFLTSAVLNAAWLATPRHARREIARLQALDLDVIRKQLLRS